MINNILGCFASTTIGDDQGAVFRSYVWGEKGINETLSKLKHKDYGKDIVRVLFQFYVNPNPYLIENISEIEEYRKKEKAIGMSLIINEENFFSKSENERFEFLINSMYDKLDVLDVVVKRKKLDTNVELLKKDFLMILESEEH
jgi:hypothetical protein